MVSSSETSDFPAPNLVGKEFVRQYYTLLHEAPQHLHRFYCNDSIFVRGKLVDNAWESEAIIGSAAIQKKLSEVTIENPYARIFTVEAHKTLGDGVVVLVCGALRHGNNAELRRFVQTFVLAPQTPKKYYVQNDVFQFVDDAFAYQVNNYPNDEERNTPPLSNGTVHLEELSGAEKVDAEHGKREIRTATPPEHVDQVVPATKVRSSPSPVGMESYHQADEYKESAETWPNAESDGGKGENLVEGEQMETYVEPHPDEDQGGATKSNEKPSWAQLVQNKPPAPSSYGPPQQQQQQGTPRPPTSDLGENQPNGAPLLEMPPNQPQQQQHRGDGRYHQQRGEFRPHVSSPGPCDCPDNQQLFIPRVPPNMNEENLREIFSKYGNVIDLRIQRRPAGGPNMHAGSAPFGFVAFDSVEPVERCRQDMPLLPNGARLNVENKRPRGSDHYKSNYGRAGGYRQDGQQFHQRTDFYRGGEGSYQQRGGNEGGGGGFPTRDFPRGGRSGGNRGGMDQQRGGGGGMRGGRNPNNPPYRGGQPPQQQQLI